MIRYPLSSIGIDEHIAKLEEKDEQIAALKAERDNWHNIATQELRLGAEAVALNARYLEALGIYQRMYIRIQHKAKTRPYASSSHHCDYRVVLEAIESQTREAIAQAAIGEVEG
jgi:uncharacterized membrane protein